MSFQRLSFLPSSQEDAFHHYNFDSKGKREGKRKVEAGDRYDKRIAEEKEESIGANFKSSGHSSALKMENSTGRMSDELCLLKEIFVAYSSGESSAPVGEYWNTTFWEKLCDEYNEKARVLGLQCLGPTSLIQDGLQLQHMYCTIRGSEALEDDGLNTIFKPCDPCNLRNVVFPTRNIIGLDKSRTPDFDDEELQVLRTVLLDYSRGRLQIQQGDYFELSFWLTLKEAYNLRCETRNRNANDMIKGGKLLQYRFNTQRVREFHFGVPTDADLKQIFGRCIPCQNRIPVLSCRGSSSSTYQNTASTSNISRCSFHNNASTSRHSVLTSSVVYSRDMKAKVRAEIGRLQTNNHITVAQAVTVLTKCTLDWWNGQSDEMIQSLISPEIGDDVKKLLVINELERLA